MTPISSIATRVSAWIDMAYRPNHAADKGPGQDVPGTGNQTIDDHGGDDAADQRPERSRPAEKNHRHGGEKRREQEIDAEPLRPLYVCPPEAPDAAPPHPPHPQHEAAAEEKRDVVAAGSLLTDRQRPVAVTH